MNYSSFISLVIEHFFLFSASLFFSLCIYVPIMAKKKCYILSPYILAFYNSISATTNLIFLFLLNEISDFYFFQYILTEFFFYTGFILPVSKKNKNSISLEINNTEKIFFSFSVFLFFTSQLLIYVILGIPLFSTSRLEPFMVGGGTGIFARINDFFSYFFIYICLFNLLIKKRKLKAAIYLFLYIITLILSGERSSIISLFIFYYSFAYIFRHEYPQILSHFKKNIKKIIFYVFIFIVITFSIKNIENLQNVFESILVRLICQGDAVFLAYPNELIENLESVGTLRLLFSDFLSTLRITPPDFRAPNLGLELVRMVVNPNVLSGTVTPHNIIGYVHYGFGGSIIFSFLLGLSMNFFYSIPKYIGISHLKNAILLCLYMIGPRCCYAFPSLLTNNTNVIIFSIFLAGLYFLVHYSKKKNIY